MIQYVVTYNSLSIELHHITYTSLLMLSMIRSQHCLQFYKIQREKQVNVFQTLWLYTSVGHHFTLNVWIKSLTYSFSQLPDMETFGLSLWISVRHMLIFYVDSKLFCKNYTIKKTYKLWGVTCTFLDQIFGDTQQCREFDSHENRLYEWHPVVTSEQQKQCTNKITSCNS